MVQPKCSVWVSVVQPKKIRGGAFLFSKIFIENVLFIPLYQDKDFQNPWVQTVQPNATKNVYDHTSVKNMVQPKCLVWVSVVQPKKI